MSTPSPAPVALPGNPAAQLLGLDLEDGWKATELLVRPPHATGGNFCVMYLAAHPSGRLGFIKALDFSKALGRMDQSQMLMQMTTMYELERDLLQKCGRDRMSKVVVSIADGVVVVPGGHLLATVNYIVFERAEGDIRSRLAADPGYDLGLRLRAVHQVATGLKQLHSRHIVHQDLKPSNVLCFQDPADGAVSKVADLGRASDRLAPSMIDAWPVPGDPGYAPPEQIYRYTASEFGERRLASDLYQLGSLLVFTLTAASLNGLLFQMLLPQHSPQQWTGPWTDVVPYVRDAYGKALDEVRNSLPRELTAEIQDDIMRVVAYLCDPEPLRRGHPRTRQLARTGNQYALDRVVTDMDRICRRIGTTRRRP
jgi:serine/threonine protein kinase